MLDAVAAELLGAVQGFVGLPEHLTRRSGVAGVEHGHPRADGEHSERVIGVRDGEPFQADPHALNRERAVGQGLLREDAQELFAAVPIQRVSPASLAGQLGRDRLEDLVAGGGGRSGRLGLEVVDVEQRHAVAMPVACHARLQELEVLVERPSVLQPGERVPAGDDDIVESVSNLSCEAGPLQGHAGGEVTCFDLRKDAQQYLRIEGVGEGTSGSDIQPPWSESWFGKSVAHESAS